MLSDPVRMVRTVLIPTRCPVCDTPGPAPCAPCAGRLEHAPALPPPAGLATCRALLRYEDAGRELLARLKYRNARSTVAWLAWQLAGLVPAGLAATIEVVTWAPTSAGRRRDRGFDQAELLARGVARQLAGGRPCVSLLARGPAPPQTGLSRDGRRRGPPFTVPRPELVPAAVLLVDDVITTGATLESAARALRGAGGREVHGLAAGRTPLRRATAMATATAKARAG